jgi:hypothetical protein
MADLFVITQDIRNIGEQAINALINQLGKLCQVVYESELVEQCPNCFFDTSNRRSTNKYNGTGPRSFTTGKCPVCSGSGFLPSTARATDTLTLLIDWQPKVWNFMDTNVTVQGALPEGGKVAKGDLVSMKGFIADMPKVMQAKHIILDYQNAQYENNRFALWGEPVVQGNIIQTKYFNAYAVRIGD